MKAVQILVLAACQGLSMAWWDVGHKTIAAIAKSQMKNEHSIEQMANILSYMDVMYNDEASNWTVGDYGSEGIERPVLESSEMVYAATFPDIAKSFYNMRAFGGWHYVNKKYDPENLDVNNTGCGTEADVHAVTQIQDLSDDVSSNYKDRQTAHWYANFATVFLIHIIGDVHQPFHSIGRCIIYKDELTQDYGGNRWRFNMPDGSSTNMHSFFDSAQMLWGTEEQIAIESSDPLYEERAANLTAKHTPETLAAAGFDTNFTRDADKEQLTESIDIWLAESYELATEFYGYVPMYGNITQENVDKAHELTEQRVALAGYRMAAYFDGLLSETSYPKLESECGDEMNATANANATRSLNAVEDESLNDASISTGALVGGTIGGIVGGLIVGLLVGHKMAKKTNTKGWADQSTTTL